MKHKINHIHFVGIGGSGMGGIAEVLINQGYQVSGSDLSENSVTSRLRQLGAVIQRQHAPENIGTADVVVYSSAIKTDNPEIVAARAQHIPVVPRAMMLAELLRLRRGIAVAGTHGKTTTTSLIAGILAEANMDPTFVIGGRLKTLGGHAKMGSGEFIVVEADESDASFLYLQPVLTVVTNIDADHMSTYGHDFNRLKQTFVEFIEHLPFYGMAMLCIDDAHVREIIPMITKPVTTYGLTNEAQVYATEIFPDHGRMHFVAHVGVNGSARRLPITLNLPGLHNVQNALAAIAIANELNISDSAITAALARFGGVERRFQHYGEIDLPGGGVFSLIDDYGHHPAEIMATLAAARGAFPGRRLLLAFQPHRFSRTRDLFEDFVKALSQADGLLLTEIYAAGEEPIIAADSKSLARAIRVHGRLEPIYVEEVEELPGVIETIARDGDVVVIMGAGAIGRLAAEIARPARKMAVIGA